MFEKAARIALRFDSSVGQISVEDIWQLPLTSKTGRANLDDLARGLHNELKSGNDISFVTEVKADDLTQLKFDIVKHIIDVRLAENSKLATLQANREKKQQILAIIATKENESLAGQSLEDLRKLAVSLAD
jgi:hypothetical protein